MAKVSILVAVYNAEKYLPKCLDSLVNQSLADIQIICIDDGSTDDSLHILHKYSKADHRIDVIALDQNEGQAKARNEGLKIAHGQYVCFLDSDDWFSSDALACMVSVFEKYPQTDCVLFHVINWQSGHKVEYPMKSFEVKSGQEAFEDSLTWKIHGVYGVRKELHIRFPYDTSAQAFSDDNTTRLHYLYASEVRCCDGIYYYRVNPNSVTHAVNIHRFDYLKANESMKQQLIQLNISKRILDIYENVRWLNVVGVYMFYFQYRHKLSEADSNYGLSEIQRVWRTIEIERLTVKNKTKFGYIPFNKSWLLFRIQEEVYFTLRQWLNR